MWRRPILIAGTLLSMVALVLAVLGIRAYMRTVSTWSGETSFAEDVADAVSDAVRDAVGEALARVDAELNEIQVGDARLTVRELAHFRELYLAGNREQLRRELSSRFTRTELEELRHRLESLAEGNSPPDRP